jgi:hypothetical protein
MLPNLALLSDKKNVISHEGISMDPVKIEAIMECLAWMNVPEVRSFIGLVAYYQRIFESFSKIANLITKLENKNKKFV